MTEAQEKIQRGPQPSLFGPVVESIEHQSPTPEEQALADDLARSGSVGQKIDLDPAPVARETATDLRVKKSKTQVLRVSSEVVRRFGCIGLSNEEMAQVLGANLADIRKQMETNPATGSQTPFSLAYHRGLAALKSSVRRKQIQMAMRGNYTMLIWIGKQLLGQREQMVSIQSEGSRVDPDVPRKITISVIQPMGPMTVPKNGSGNGNGNGSRLLHATEEEAPSHDGAN